MKRERKGGIKESNKREGKEEVGGVAGGVETPDECHQMAMIRTVSPWVCLRCAGRHGRPQVGRCSVAAVLSPWPVQFPEASGRNLSSAMADRLAF